MHGVSTRSVGDLDKALGCGTGISRSEVFRSCADLDEQLDAFWTRPPDHIRLPNLFLDATYVKAARVDHRNASQAIVFAAGAARDGSREVAGVMAGDSETEVFWAQFLRHLHERGLCGVRLVIPDSHSGPVKAIRKVCQVLTDLFGRLLGASPALPGAVHDVRAAREHGIVDALAEAGVKCSADKAYQGAGGTVRTSCWARWETLCTGQRTVNRSHCGNPHTRRAGHGHPHPSGASSTSLR